MGFKKPCHCPSPVGHLNGQNMTQHGSPSEKDVRFYRWNIDNVPAGGIMGRCVVNRERFTRDLQFIVIAFSRVMRFCAAAATLVL